MLDENNVHIGDGVTLAMIAPSKDPKYSPNLHAWLRRNYKSKWHVAADKDDVLWLVRFSDGGYSSGCRLMSVLCSGRKTTIWDTTDRLTERNIVVYFWSDYQKNGRCAIDPHHTTWFIDDDKRWSVSSDGCTRECCWCGQFRQQKVVESRPHERWVPASV